MKKYRVEIEIANTDYSDMGTVELKIMENRIMESVIRNGYLLINSKITEVREG